MKRLFVLVALFAVFLMVGRVIAADDDKFNVGEWRIDSGGTLIPSTAAGSYIIYETYAGGSNNTLLAAESGKVITDNGLQNAVGAKHILPRAAVGLNYTICAGSPSIYVTVDTVDTSDTIRYSSVGVSLDAGDSLKSSGSAGDCLGVACTEANKWTVTYMGPHFWTDNGTN